MQKLQTPFLGLVVIGALFLSPSLSAKSKKGALKSKRSKSTISRRLSSGTPPDSIKLNYLLGLQIVDRQSALNMGAQLGFLAKKGSTLYGGPEVNFSYFGPTSRLNLMLGGWWETGWFNQPNLVLGLGLWGGMSVLSRPVLDNKLDPLLLAEMVIIHHLDKYASVCGQFRGGFLDKSVTFFSHFNISFRF